MCSSENVLNYRMSMFSKPFLHLFFKASSIILLQFDLNLKSIFLNLFASLISTLSLVLEVRRIICINLWMHKYWQEKNANSFE